MLGALALLIAAAWWMTSTAAGFRWLAETAASLSRGQLAIEGVSGHLAAPLGIRRLTLVTETQRITLEQLRLEWQPRALWQKRLDIDLLAIRRIRLETLKEDPTPPTLPDTLRLPLSVNVATWDVGQLDVVNAGQTIKIKPLRGTLADDGDRYRLTATATTPWAGVDGRLEIDKDAPFRLAGRLTADLQDRAPAQATLDVSGQLAAVAFKLDAQSEEMSLMASGEVAPFARIRLPSVVLAGQGINPRRFSQDAPQADLAFSGVFEGQPGERLLGTFSLANRQPGRLDQERLPLANLTGAVLGDSVQADFSSLAIDLGQAGQLTGTGEWRDGRFSVRLSSPAFNLAGLHRDLHPTRIRTELKLAGDAGRQTLTADVAESWGQGRFTVSLADNVLELRDATFSGETGKLTASGRLGLDARRAFEATFDASRINPARLGDFPRARLNARGTVSGALLPDLSLQAQFTLPPGELEGRPVKGQGTLRYANRHLADADIDVDLAGNRATVKGSYGRVGDRLAWDINAPALARLNLGLAGRLTSTGNASGEPLQPNIEGQLAARGLKLPGDMVADSLDLQLKLQASATGAFNGALDARGIRVAGQRIDSVRASVDGRRSAHGVSLDVRLPDWQVLAALSGGLGTDNVWRGQLNQARVQGAWPMTLNAPAALVLGRDQQQVGNLALTLAGGQVSIVQFNRQGTQMSTRGTLSNLPLAPLLALLEQPPPVETDLRVSGDWNLRLHDTLDGQASLVRQNGDVRLKDPAMNLGLTRLGLDLKAQANRVTARLEVDTREAGQVRAEGTTTLERADGGFTLPRTAPLAWNASLDVPDLRLIRALLPVGIRLNARLAAKLAGSGSLAAPRIDGQIDASRIRFAMPEEGIAITDGTLGLVLSDDRVKVRQGELKGSSGRIVVSGEAQLKNPQAGLTLNFEQFAATNRSDRRVIVSGATQLNLDPRRLQLNGKLVVDRARLEMPEASRPELSSDVVIVGHPPREKPVAQRLPLALDLTVGLGNDFLFKGAGLDARLGGQLRVFTVNQALRQDRPQGEGLAAYPVRVLRGEGTIKVEKGRYAAYAQTLDIERGVLRFAGPIDNPGLDVLAVRKTTSVTAGVQVGGTVQNPVVKLFSDPAMPDTEKLSWLVLGHGLEGSGQQEFVLLQVAASALLSQAESVNFQTKMADTLGIDSFDVRTGGDELSSAVVSVGKRLSSRATLSYEQSIDGLSQVVKVLYQLTPSIRLEAQAGQQSSFDVFYSREYD